MKPQWSHTPQNCRQGMFGVLPEPTLPSTYIYLHYLASFSMWLTGGRSNFQRRCNCCRVGFPVDFPVPAVSFDSIGLTRLTINRLFRMAWCSQRTNDQSAKQLLTSNAWTSSYLFGAPQRWVVITKYKLIIASHSSDSSWMGACLSSSIWGPDKRSPRKGLVGERYW